MTTQKLKFIDAHHHLWDLEACHYPWLMEKGVKRFFGDPTPIQKNYLVDDFLSESERYTPEKSVHIQVGTAAGDSLKESHWLQSQPSYPHSIVAFCDLSSSTLEQDLEQQQQYSRVKGVRQIIGRHSIEDLKHGSDSLLLDPNWLEGLKLLAYKGLSFDLQLIPPQVLAIAELLQQVPNLKVALCHCGSPWDQSPEGLANWKVGLKKLAELPNVYCKVSGLGMFNPHWQSGDIEEIIHSVIETFSCRRVMFGSNFPVDKLYGSYDKIWDAYIEILKDFTAEEQHQMLYSNALNFYQM